MEISYDQSMLNGRTLTDEFLALHQEREDALTKSAWQIQISVNVKKNQGYFFPSFNFLDKSGAL